MPATELTAKAEWKRHWPLVVAAGIGFSFMSLMNPALGVFMDPLAQEFGWNRTQLTAGFAVSSALSILCSPFIGVLIDRFGTRRLALPGIVLTALAIAAYALANGSFVQWIALWVAWGLCSLLIVATVWSTAVAGVFSKGRGLALGLTMSGTALAQVVAPPLTNWLIEGFGWRAAFVALGAGWGGIAFVLALLWLYDIFDIRGRELAQVRKTEGFVEPEAVQVDLPGLSIAEAWRDWSLWRVAISSFLILTVTIAVSVHQFPILVEAGVSRDTAAWLVSLNGVAGIAGKLITGTLIDRFHARWIGGITLASTAIAYPLMMEGVGGPMLIVIGIVISGYAAGTKIQLCSYLTARYAGIRNYGKIFGAMSSFVALAATVGPLMAGVLHDRFDSYAPLLLGGVAVSLISGALVFSLGRYPGWEARPAVLA